MNSIRLSRVRVVVAAGLAGTGLLLALALGWAGDTLLVDQPLDRPEAIVVLASHEWERLPVAVALARRHPSARLLLTLPVEVTEHNCHKCSERVNWLTEAGVDRTRVTVLPHLVTNTYDEASASKAFAVRHGIDRLVIVTSPYHGRRALATFRHLFQSTDVAVDLGLVTNSSGIDPARWWLRRYDREYVAYEWAGILYYAVRFGVVPTV